MNKNLITALCLITVLMLSSCKKQDIYLFLSNQPITINNYSVIPEIPVFKAGDRIYFALVSKEDIECSVLRLQTIKLDNKYGYPIPQMEIPYAIDFERGENKKVVMNYFVLRQSGNYFVRIFKKDNLNKPIIQAEFIIEGR